MYLIYFKQLQRPLLAMSDDQQLDLFQAPEPAAPEPEPVPFDRIPFDSKLSIPAGTYADMEALGGHCRQCQRCDLGTTRTQAVIGRGNIRAPLMAIGEAPGQNEDETGLPFVGRAGQLLEKILAAVRLNTETDVYICNIIKCRPPGNRDPMPGEIEACKPYLLEQIRLCDPKVILLTGKIAVKTILGEKRGITKIRGQWFSWEGRDCMPIFHPAYLLRNPSREKGSPKWLMWQDIQAVRSKLDELAGAGNG